MSWVVSAKGKPAEVTAEIAKQVAHQKCVEPEEGVRLAALALIEKAVDAQNRDAVITVSGSGHQSGVAPACTNTLSVSVQPS